MEDSNYFVVQGWMRNRLGLKGNELTVYAIIYGFSRDSENHYAGSIKYIQEWLGIKSKQTVYSTISSLVEKGLVEKTENTRNGVKFCTYRAVRLEQPKKVVKTYNLNTTNIDNSIYVDVIEYLNKKAGSSYNPNARNTKALINARLKEGNTLDDFIHVIDVKCAEWLNTEFDVYLRPATLFGNKFESYKNQKMINKKPKNGFANFDQRQTDYTALENNNWMV